MTEQTNADLIAEARVIWEADDLYPDQMIPRLVEALEAAERRAEQAESQQAKVEAHIVMLLRNGRQVLDQRNQLAAVEEKVRAWADEAIGYGEPSGDTVSDLLATAPADLLRDVKADVWDEGADAMAEHIDNGAWWEIQNPYREEQS